ncbi:uncharacterized protein PSFLO_01487 [Pseudozyma flocculosa]|uniref:Secreted protein n=1 Tax=Pseudozyma flocculosa TaxID=84751 RepID=A0A5C3EWP3_9BASI|nr:uncharacterized protein PSFLO_01487 [Pseudozyma flocculosa]
MCVFVSACKFAVAALVLLLLFCAVADSFAPLFLLPAPPSPPYFAANDALLLLPRYCRTAAACCHLALPLLVLPLNGPYCPIVLRCHPKALLQGGTPLACLKPSPWPLEQIQSILLPAGATAEPHNRIRLWVRAYACGVGAMPSYGPGSLGVLRPKGRRCRLAEYGPEGTKEISDSRGHS